jgi:hypothetical protein
VTGGRCKLQWRVDWPMRWYALSVDYEMSGKDLIDSVKLGSQICRILGGRPPDGFNYELFLDEKGQKISKSKGNGLSVEGVAALRTGGKFVAVHVSEAARGQAALFRCYPAHGRRLSRILTQISRRGAAAAARKSRLAHP